MFLDNILSKAIFWFKELEMQLNEDKASRVENEAEYRKKRLVQDLLLASSGSAEAIARILKSVFKKSDLKELAPEYQAMYADALKIDANKLRHSELQKLKAELPGQLLSVDYKHDELANKLGSSIGIADSYSINDLKQLLADKHKTLSQA